MRNKILAIATVLMVGACATTPPPTSAELMKIGYGKEPSREEAVQAAKDVLEGYLKDPYSAQWSCDRPYKGWWRDAGYEGGQLHVGWRMECRVNAKNSYGGYTGAQRYTFIIKHGRVEGAWAYKNDYPTKIF